MGPGTQEPATAAHFKDAATVSLRSQVTPGAGTPTAVWGNKGRVLQLMGGVLPLSRPEQHWDSPVGSKSPSPYCVLPPLPTPTIFPASGTRGEDRTGRAMVTHPGLTQDKPGNHQRVWSSGLCWETSVPPTPCSGGRAQDSARHLEAEPFQNHPHQLQGWHKWRCREGNADSPGPAPTLELSVITTRQ